MKLSDEAVRICARVMALLREERESQGLSGSQLAERSGLNQSTISLLDRGERKPTLETLVRISGVLGIEPGQLLTGAMEDVRNGLDLSQESKRKTRTGRAK